MCCSNWWLTNPPTPPGLALFPTLLQMQFPGVGEKSGVQTRPSGWGNLVLVSGGREKENVVCPRVGRGGEPKISQDSDHLMTSQLRHGVCYLVIKTPRKGHFNSSVCARCNFARYSRGNCTKNGGLLVHACPVVKWFQFLVYVLLFSIKITRKISSPFGEKWDMNTHGKSQVIGILITVD